MIAVLDGVIIMIAVVDGVMMLLMRCDDDY